MSVWYRTSFPSRVVNRCSSSFEVHTFGFLLQVEYCVLVLLGLEVFVLCNCDVYIFEALPTSITIYSLLFIFFTSTPSIYNL